MLDRLTIERMAADDGPILVALSGGGDSVALLHLLHERFGAARLRAAVVDHKLREGSGADAKRAVDIARGLAVEARVLELAWPDGANRAHEAARKLRYAALCGEARRVDARIIATGHTRDDQAETVLLRAARGSGMRGLAGMRAFSPAPLWPEGRGRWLARPLLGARRESLRAHLRALNAAWIEDPANANPVHARVRARAVLAELPGEGFDPMRFAALAERLQPHVLSLDKEAAALVASAATFNADEIVLDRARWQGDDAVLQRALEALLIAASGAERGPAPARLASLSTALSQLSFTGATLAGAWLEPRAGGAVVVRRDPGALSGRAGGAAPIEPLALAPDRETVWDGRVALTMTEPGWSLVCHARAPLLQRDEERRPLAAAAPHWLLRERVQHVLGTD